MKGDIKMTNREWYLNKLNKMTNEELANYIEAEITPWCAEATPWCSHSCPDDCAQCAKAWLDKTHQEPMPKLEVGMFVCCVNDVGEKNLGIVVSKKPIGFDGLVIAYHDGRWDEVYNVYITNIYNAVCFNGCRNETCIWRKDEN